MTIPTHDHSIPPYVHDLVVEAGRDNIFWASARDPGERPDTGGSMSEWRNRVVGSSRSATQSTASAQPIWRGTEIEFGGDDALALSGVPADPDAMVFWWVSTGISSTGRVFAHLESSVDPSVLITARANSGIGYRIESAGGNSDKISPLTTSDQPHIGLMRCDLTSPTASLDAWTYASGRLEERVGRISVSSNGDFSSNSTQIGAEDDSSPVYMTGGIQEIGYVTGILPDDETMRDLVLTVQTKWGI